MSRPDPAHEPHAGHDRLLVAALVAGDLKGAEAEGAQRLLDTCADCAELARDLAVVTRAIRMLPPRARPRDFRVTSEQAESLRSRGLRRFLPAGRPSLAFARPLGLGLATLGLAGLLFTALPAAQVATMSALGGAAGAPASRSADQSTSTSEADIAKGTASPVAQPQSAASAAAAAGPSAAPGVGSSAAPSAAPSPASSAAPSQAAGDGRLVPGPSVAPSTEPAGSGTASGPTTESSTSSPLLAAQGGGNGNGVPVLPALSIVSLLAGVGLIGAERIARRR